MNADQLEQWATQVAAALPFGALAEKMALSNLLARAKIETPEDTMPEKTETPEPFATCSWKRGDPTPNLNRALARALGEMDLAAMESTGRVGSEEKGGVRWYKYANLASAISAARAALAKHGLAPMQEVETVEDGVIVRTLLLHESGEEREQQLKMPLVYRTAQGYGSAMTYGRRYALCAMLNIAGEVDDDGKSASEPMQPSQSLSAARAPIDPSKLVAAFAALGITAEQIAARLGHQIATVSATEEKMLRGWYDEAKKAHAKPPPRSPEAEEQARLEVQRQAEAALALAEQRERETKTFAAAPKTDELTRDDRPPKPPKQVAFEAMVDRIRAAQSAQEVTLIHAEAQKGGFTPGDLKALHRACEDRRLILADAAREKRRVRIEDEERPL